MATAEQIGRAIVAAIRENAWEVDPKHRPGFYAVEGYDTLAGLLPPDYARSMYRGLRWIDNHGEFGVLGTEWRGHRPAYYFLLTDPARVDDFHNTARSNVKYITTRTRRWAQKVDNVVTLVKPDETVMRAVRTAVARSEANHQAAVMLLADLLNVDEAEAEGIWLGLVQNEAQPV